MKNQKDWYEYCKLGNKPENIPSNASLVYKQQWKSWGDWVGTGYISRQNRTYLPFEEARNYVHKLCLKNYKEWSTYCKSGKKPDNIPMAANDIYKKEWQGFGDWLGTGVQSTRNKQYRSFEDARKYVQELKLRNLQEWLTFCRSGNKPVDIPQKAERVYAKKWKGVGDWLGTDFLATQKRKYRSFEDAIDFVRGLGLKGQEDWLGYCKSGEKPADIPSNPDNTYKDNWKGYGDWLGTGFISTHGRIHLPFEEARQFVRSLKFGSKAAWDEYCKSGNKPSNIPAEPRRPYIKEWKGWGDWLGTGYTVNRNFRPFVLAREYVHSLGLKDKEAWKEYCKTAKPNDIPSNPDKIYQKEWNGYSDWIGYEGTWTTVRIKGLLRDLIKSKILYQWDEAVLYSFLLRKGLLNLDINNRHEYFFKNLIQAVRNNDSHKVIENYAKFDTDIPPNLTNLTPRQLDNQEEIQLASPEELSPIPENTDPLDYRSFRSVEHILMQTDVLESINVDEEAIQFYLKYSIDELWKLAFANEDDTLKKIRIAGKNGNKYHDTVLDNFLYDYEGSRKPIIPPGYTFSKPTLMQLYVAYKVKMLPYFGNFSGTGAGKTLSAILASRVIDSKITIVVCPNDVVEQWKNSILNVFPDSKVITGREAFYAKNSDKEHQYLVLNYDKFSQDDSPNLILALARQRIDFVVLDEIHFTKIRDEDEISRRRNNLDGLMTAARKKNRHVKVLGLSATPVVNNLREGKSLLELITGKIYNDVITKPTIPNAVTLYEKLSTISIRELPDYHVDVDTHFYEVEAKQPSDVAVRQLKSNPLIIEKFLTDARIPEIVKHIEGQTVIYTEYVEDIIQKLSTAVKRAGFSFALYTGSDRSGLKPFIDKKIQVLIASRPISVGVDRLQHICNRLIINTLPWTNAQYQQLLGRLVRMGQIRDVVHVYIIKASIGGYQYDELKWKRIQFKRTLSDCAVDGVLPEKNLVTPQQADMEAVRWLERLDRGEISRVTRRDLNVELTPVQIRRRLVRYGNFTKLNNRINNENSVTTNVRMSTDPEEWEEYHRQYREARKTWPIIPYEEIVMRIKQLSPRLMIGDFGCGEAEDTIRVRG